jgi:DNA-binding NtrC family response regulator
VRAEHLPPEYAQTPPRAGAPAASSSEPSADTMTMDEIERRAILDALEKTGGNRTQAAEMLGIGLRTLQRKLKEYRLTGRAGGN